MTEKLEDLAPGRLTALLEEGLRGHHVLFRPEVIRAAFEAPDEVVSRDEATDVGRTLLAICRGPLPEARAAVDHMPDRARTALVRLWFRLIDRAQSERAQRQ